MLLVPALLLTACGPLPFPGSGPESSVGQPRPRKPSAETGQAKGSPPALAPLATQQQVVKAVTAGRRDPFGRVLTPIITLPLEAMPKAPAKEGLPAPPAVLEWPKGLAFEGVLQSFSETEAMVRYTPADAKSGGTRHGALRVGDIGTGAYNSLLPPGWQVAAIDGDQGVLVLRRGGQIVSQLLPRL